MKITHSLALIEILKYLNFHMGPAGLSFVVKKSKLDSISCSYRDLTHFLWYFYGDISSSINVRQRFQLCLIFSALVQSPVTFHDHMMAIDRFIQKTHIKEDEEFRLALEMIINLEFKRKRLTVNNVLNIFMNYIVPSAFDQNGFEFEWFSFKGSLRKIFDDFVRIHSNVTILREYFNKDKSIIGKRIFVKLFAPLFHRESGFDLSVIENNRKILADLSLQDLTEFDNQITFVIILRSFHLSLKDILHICDDSFSPKQISVSIGMSTMCVKIPSLIEITLLKQLKSRIQKNIFCIDHILDLWTISELESFLHQANDILMFVLRY